MDKQFAEIKWDALVWVQPPLYLIRKTAMQANPRPQGKFAVLQEMCGCGEPVGDILYIVDGKKVCKDCERENWRKKSGFRPRTIDIDTGRIGQHRQNPPAGQPGNINNTFYRYMIGSPLPEASIRICRCCHAVFHSHEDWIAHNEKRRGTKESTCPVMLRLAYARLLPKFKCIVCDNQTYRDSWGVPLCGLKCDEIWKFKTGPNMALVNELMSVVASERHMLDSGFRREVIADEEA